MTLIFNSCRISRSFHLQSYRPMPHVASGSIIGIIGGSIMGASVIRSSARSDRPYRHGWTPAEGNLLDRFHRAGARFAGPMPYVRESLR
jgi:hypothetical protein